MVSNTALGKMKEIVPYYIAKYVEWYLTDKNERCSWEDLCKCDINFNVTKKVDGKPEWTGEYKTEKFAEENWLTREDTQKAIQVYMKHMKTYNTMQIYQKMMEKALQGDVNAAKYIDTFHNSDFFDESDDELNDFLNTVKIPALKKHREGK